MVVEIKYLVPLKNFFFFFFFWAMLNALWDLSSLTRDLTGPSAVKAQSPNHWTAREIPTQHFLKKIEIY